MADANTLGKFELNTRLAGSRNSLNLEDLKLGLDDTALSLITISEHTRREVIT